MNLDREKQHIETIKRCQRNWDYSKSIPQQHIDHWLWIAKNAPSKQYEGYYSVWYAQQPEVIRELAQETWGFTWSTTPDPASCVRNPQANANLYLVFVSRQPHTMHNFNQDGTPRDSNYEGRRHNSLVSIGMAMGLIARSAAELGYRTGFNKNHVGLTPGSWEQRMGLDQARESDPGLIQIEYGMGIGYPQAGRTHSESDEHEIQLGNANGYLSTTDPDCADPDRVPVIIADSSRTDRIQDPQGEWHQMPGVDTITYPSLSETVDRGIVCREIL
jgi:hypothetical protein